ncbi:MAG: endonuclease [Saprospiraceae bacterium]|nr:endonuclease [Saprospiraceae bacterium]
MRWLCFVFLFGFVDRCDQFRSNSEALNYKDSYRIVSYNVENLFDTWDEPYKFDDDFTPMGANRWTRARYEKKVQDIGKVLVNAAGDKVPAVIGLIEVENRKVLEDLLNNSPLRKFQYAIIHEDSPDERGIDVAFLYDTDQFNYIDYQIGRIEFPDDVEDETRDILMVKGSFGKDTVFFAVNHWPSRRGGVAETAPKRMHVAETLRAKTDAIRAKQPNAHIILMGDFNDSPFDVSVANGLKAGALNNNTAPLINLMSERYRNGQGTYKYQNQWNMLDHFIVSRNLLDEEGKLFIADNSLQIFAPDYLREADPNYPGERIFRTYRGPNYVGGYSDHFPIVLDVFVR